MERAGIIDDPLFETNFKNNTWDNTFVYAKKFTFTSNSSTILLIFDGIKMGSYIHLNGVRLGETADQFLRYTFDVTNIIQRSNINLLEVIFPTSKSELNDQSRFMACSGAWDWAPYGTTFTANGSHTFSKGIWKSVYLASIDTIGIEHIVPHIFYEGNYPTKPLTDDTAGPWRVEVKVHFFAPTAINGVLKVSINGEWLGSSSSEFISLNSGKSIYTTNLHIPVGKVRLWWPQGLGGRLSYTLNVEFETYSSNIVITQSRPIGFRLIYLVTGDDSNPMTLDSHDGSDSFTMQIMVNGAKIWARGSNLIPTDEMEGRNSREAYFYMLKSAADAHYNILRVWGGGVYFPDYVYNLADQFGILLFHDMMYGYPWFGGNSGVPEQNEMQESELKYQIRRLSNHPSIAIWNSCNECDPTSSEINFVAETVVSEDKSRPAWPASPSMGWQSGVHTLTGLPNGLPLVAKSLNTYLSSKRSKNVKNNCNMQLELETHGYYQHGEGFQTVNSQAALNEFDPNIPPKLDPIFELGSQCPGTFASEFGASAWSSFESVSPTLSPDHWNLHALPMYERNYAADNEIVAYFPVHWPTDFETSSEYDLKKQLYLAMVSQALIVKSDISTRRSRNSFGTLTWQHNEIWPTGGWGSIEYGSVGYTSGQVVGGRWKPLQYFYKDHLFTDLFVSCSIDARCFVKNDNPLKPVNGNLKLKLLNIDNSLETLMQSRTINLKNGLTKDASMWFCADSSSHESNTNNCISWDNLLPLYNCTINNCILLMIIESLNGDELYNSFELLAPPKFMELPKANITFSLKCDPELGTTEIIINSDNVGLFVGLTTKASGRFDHNFFILPAGEKKITFVPFGHLDCNLLIDTTRIEHVALYF